MHWSGSLGSIGSEHCLGAMSVTAGLGRYSKEISVVAGSNQRARCVGPVEGTVCGASIPNTVNKVERPGLDEKDTGKGSAALMG